jgi:hypothetical protein
VKQDKNQKLILFSIMLLLLLSYPMITVANKVALAYGFPVLYLYIFIVWITAIVVTYSITAQQYKEPDE